MTFQPTITNSFGIGLGSIATLLARKKASGATTIGPGASWNGTAGSGYGTPPSDPTRTTAKPVLNMLVVPNQVFTANLDLVVSAFALGGITKVRAYCEGNTLDLTTPQWVNYTDVNGTAQTMFGFKVTLKKSSFDAINASGAANVYFEAFPTDGTMQHRVIGPFAFYNRASAYSATRTVAPSGANHTTIQAALDWISANQASARNVNIQITQSGNYDCSGNVTTQFSNATMWATITAAGGVTANITAGATRTNIRLQYDGIRFAGSGIVFDAALYRTYIAESLGNGGVGSNLAQVWFDGCAFTETGGRMSVFDGMPPDISWLSPSSGAHTVNGYMTDCTSTDVFDGPVFFVLCRNWTSSTAFAGQAIRQGQSNSASHGFVCPKVSPGGAGGLRTQIAGMNITYTGGGTSAKIAVTRSTSSSPAGTDRVASLWKNGAQVGTSLTLSNPAYAAGGSGYTTWTQFVAWVNAQGGAAGFAATVNGAAGTRRAASATRAGLLPTDAMDPGSGNELDVFSGSGTMNSIFDVHGDGLHYYGDVTSTIANTEARFVKINGIDSLNGVVALLTDNTSTAMQDGVVRNLELSSDGGGITANAQFCGAASHWCLTQSVLYDIPLQLRPDSAYVPDTYCSVDNTAFVNCLWSGTPAANQKINNINDSGGTLPSGATNSTTFSTSLYNGAPSDLSPVSGGNLSNGDGTYKAARTPTGSYQTP